MGREDSEDCLLNEEPEPNKLTKLTKPNLKGEDHDKIEYSMDKSGA